jgi:hypothetical protein
MRCMPTVLYTAKSVADGLLGQPFKNFGRGAYSLDQIVPKSALNLTKGNMKEYTYYGDTGKSFYTYEEHHVLLLRR